jgi:hypothetical protein ypesF_10274
MINLAWRVFRWFLAAPSMPRSGGVFYSNKQKMAKRFALLTLLLLAGAAIAETYTGKAIYISDGDTLSVLVDEAESKTVYKIRLRHIDAPERKQPWGKKATEALKKLIDGRMITATCYGQHWERHICDVVRDDGLDVQREMVAQGAAWVSYKYNTRDDLWAVQRDAKDARRGLWALPPEERIDPARWREMQRNKNKKKADVPPGENATNPHR